MLFRRSPGSSLRLGQIRSHNAPFRTKSVESGPYCPLPLRRCFFFGYDGSKRRFLYFSPLELKALDIPRLLMGLYHLWVCVDCASQPSA